MAVCTRLAGVCSTIVVFYLYSRVEAFVHMPALIAPCSVPCRATLRPLLAVRYVSRSSRVQVCRLGQTVFVGLMCQSKQLYLCQSWRATVLFLQELSYGVASTIRLPGSQAPVAASVQRQAVPGRVPVPLPQVADLEDILKERDACGVRISIFVYLLSLSGCHSVRSVCGHQNLASWLLRLVNAALSTYERCSIQEKRLLCDWLDCLAANLAMWLQWQPRCSGGDMRMSCCVGWRHCKPQR